MDSQKEFIYEVPIVPLESLKAELIEDECSIVEEELNASTKDVTIQENNITSTEELNVAPTYQINEDSCALVDGTKDFIQNDTNTNISNNSALDCNNPSKDIAILNECTSILKDVLITHIEGSTSNKSEVRNVEINKPNSTIILDDSPDDYASKTIKRDLNAYDQLYRENILLLELLEKCLNMENSKGMLRIFNKTLIPIYLDADKSYRMSESFKTFLLKQLVKLNDFPERKFSHIKEICELLKLYNKGEKKKVSFVTLENNLKGNRKRRKRRKFRLSSKKRRKVHETSVPISSDSDTDVEIINNTTPVQIDLDSDDSTDNHLNDNCISLSDSDDHIDDNDDHVNNNDDHVNDNDDYVNDNDDHLNDVQVNDNHSDDNNPNNAVVFLDDEDNSNTGNDVDLHDIAKTLLKSVQSDLNYGDDDVVAIADQNDNSNKENDDTNGDIPKDPKSAEISLPNSNISNTENVTSKSDKVKEKIKYYEKEIQIYNKFVENLEKREVIEDTFASPYVMCEEYKKKIVQLYKQICRLTGTEAVKRHEVRLKVTPGHPEGPVRCLEQFVNDNIDEHGNPPFPDMGDVVECVSQANSLYNMNWTYGQVLDEARALFIHYGRAMQKRRKQREWRHLLKYMKEETVDPAEIDPVLEAKLAENDRISRRREQELLDRYAELEKTNPHFDMNVSEDDSDSPPTVSNISSVIKPRETVSLNSYENSCSGNLNKNVSMFVSSSGKNVVNNTTSSVPNACVNIELPIPNNVNQQNVIILCNTPAIPQHFVSVIQNLPVLNISAPVANIVQAVPNVNRGDAQSHSQGNNLNQSSETLVVNIDQNDSCIINPRKGALTVNHAQKPTDRINHSENNLDVENRQKNAILRQPKDALHVDQTNRNSVLENAATKNMGSFAPMITHKVIHNEDPFSYKAKIVFENCSQESPEDQFESLNDEKEESISTCDREDSMRYKKQNLIIYEEETNLPMKEEYNSCDKELENNLALDNCSIESPVLQFESLNDDEEMSLPMKEEYNSCDKELENHLGLDNCSTESPVLQFVNDDEEESNLPMKEEYSCDKELENNLAFDTCATGSHVLQFESIVDVEEESVSSTNREDSVRSKHLNLTTNEQETSLPVKEEYNSCDKELENNLELDNCSIASPDCQFESINDVEDESISTTDREDSLRYKNRNLAKNEEETILPIKEYNSSDKELENLEVNDNCSIESPDHQFETLNEKENTKHSAVEKEQILTSNDKESTSVSKSCDKELDNTSEPDNVTVKRETEGLPNLLEELGDVTATIIAIDDPFVVVEISDSSDSEDDDIFLR